MGKDIAKNVTADLTSKIPVVGGYVSDLVNDGLNGILPYQNLFEIFFPGEISGDKLVTRAKDLGQRLVNEELQKLGLYSQHTPTEHKSCSKLQPPSQLQL